MFHSVREPQGKDLNKIYSMEIFGTAFDLGYNVLFTPLGAMISNVVSWLVPAALGSPRNLAHTYSLSLPLPPSMEAFILSDPEINDDETSTPSGRFVVKVGGHS